MAIIENLDYYSQKQKNQCNRIHRIHQRMTSIFKERNPQNPTKNLQQPSYPFIRVEIALFD